MLWLSRKLLKYNHLGRSQGRPVVALQRKASSGVAASPDRPFAAPASDIAFELSSFDVLPINTSAGPGSRRGSGFRPDRG